MVVEEQIELARSEAAYFDTLLQQVQAASPKDIDGIREELVDGGYIRERQRRNSKKLQNSNQAWIIFLHQMGQRLSSVKTINKMII